MHLLLTRKHNINRWALLLLGLVLVIFSHGALSILPIVSTVFYYRYLSRKLTAHIADSKIILIVIALFTYVGVLSLCVILCSALGNIDLRIPLILALVVSVGLLCFVRHRSATLETRPFILKTDWLALLATSFVAFAIAGFPLYHSGALSNHSNFLVLLTGNTDFSPHLGMFNDYLDFNNTRPWERIGDVRSALGGFYPSSWHAANAVITKSFLPGLRPGDNSAIIFGLLHVFWICIFVYLWARSAFALYKKVSAPTSTRVSLLAMLLGIIAASLFFVIDLARFGFFSYVPQLIALILLMHMLQQLRREGLNKNSVLGLAVLFCTISLATWILLLPIFAGTLVCMLALVLRNAGFRGAVKEVYRDIKSDWILYVLSLLAVGSQTMVIHSSPKGTSVSLLQGLLLNGGAPQYNVLLFLVIIGGFGAFIYLNQHKNQRELHEPVLIATSVALVFLMLVFMIQTYLTGTTHYYYYKSLMLLPALLVPPSIAALGILINKISSREALTGLAAALCIPISLVLFLPSDMGVISYAKGPGQSFNAINKSIYSEMREGAKANKQQVTIYLLREGMLVSDVSSLLAQTDRASNSCFTELRTKYIYGAELQTALNTVNSGTRLPRSCDNASVKFVVDPTTSTAKQHAHYSVQTL